MNDKIKFNRIELEILKIVQDNIPDSPMPFMEIANTVGTTEDKVITFLNELKTKGIIRRFGATLKHQIAGYECNVMVAWKIDDEENIDNIKDILVKRPEITHCYIRKTSSTWPYNLYTMIHGRCQKECISLVEELKKLTGITEYQLLFSDEELKKTSMKYF